MNEDTRIMRAPRNKEHPYFMLRRHTAQDESISYRALGLLVYLLSKPDNWEVKLTDLTRRKLGREALYKVLDELKEAGYLEYVTPREKGKFIGGHYIIHEIPHRITENQDTVSPDTVFSTLQNKESLESTEEKPRKRSGVDFSHVLQDALIDAYYDTTRGVVTNRYTPKRRTCVGQLMRENIQTAHITEYLTAAQKDEWRKGAYPSFDEMCGKIVAWYEHRAKTQPPRPTNTQASPALVPIIPDVSDGAFIPDSRTRETEY